MTKKTDTEMMRFTADRKELCAVLARVQKVIGGRITLPVLGCVRLEVKPMSVLMASGTNLDQWVSMKLRVSEPSQGVVVVCASRLLKGLEKMSASLVSVVELNGRVVVRGGEQELSLVAMDPWEFPAEPKVFVEQSWPACAGWWRDAFGGVGYAMSADDSRYILNGVRIESVPAEGGNVLSFVATDGRRLASWSEEVEAESPWGVIVPRVAVLCLQGLIAGLPWQEDPDEEQVTMELGENGVRWDAPEWRYFSKAIEGVYPNWRGVVPDQSGNVLEVNAERLLESIAFCRSVVDAGGAMRMRVEGAMMYLQGVMADVGEAADAVALLAPGSAMVTAFNSVMLAEMVEAASRFPEYESVVRLDMKDAQSPLLVARPGAQHVLMPMRVD